MDKNAIFNEFKNAKNNIVKDEKKLSNVSEKTNENINKEETNVKPIESQIIKFKNSKRNKRKHRRKDIKQEVKEEIKNVPSLFEDWKQNFLNDKTNKEFLELLNYYRSKNVSIFTDEEFLENKYKHPQARTVLFDPTLLEINAGKGGTAYLVKPLYMDEYNYFLKNIGTREEKPEEFMKYAIKTGVLYPELDDKQIDITGAGTILALYNYILQFSDLTKTVKILEV